MCGCWDTLLCCFGCLTCLGMRDKITRKLVFFPPPCTYSFEDAPIDAAAASGKPASSTLWLYDEDHQLVSPYASEGFSVHKFHTRRHETLAAFFVRQPEAKFTILFSHGNATDIGCMRDHLIDLSIQLNVNVFCYDYSGYGLSTGECTVANVQADILGAFSYLTEELQVPENTVVLYGQSLGSGPTCYLASRREGANIAGVILHSPLTSGVRVIRPNASMTFFFDILPNIDWVKKIEKPVFIIHGSADREIPAFHGQALYENSNRKYEPWFVDGAGHNDIEFHWREELFANIAQFLDFVSVQVDTSFVAAAPDGQSNRHFRLSSNAERRTN